MPHPTPRRLFALMLCACVIALPACDSGSNESNEAPSASFTFSPQEPSVGVEVEFTANAADPDGSIAEHSWDFDGDSNSDATGATASYSFRQEGDADITLTITDDEGATTSVSETVSVGPPTVAGEWSSSPSGSSNAIYELSVEEPRPVDDQEYEAVTGELTVAGDFTDTKDSGQFRRPNLQFLFTFDGANDQIVFFLVNVDLSDDGRRLVGEIEDESVTLYRQ